MEFKFPTAQDLDNAVTRVASKVHKTPVLTSTQLDQQTQASLFFKCENFQKGGSYKLRGAMNASLSLSDEERAKGIATHSSGNFAQAVAICGKSLNVPAYVVMPVSAPKIKVNAVKDYGAQITICPPTLKDREEQTRKIIEKTGASFLHPSNQIEVILGQATCSIELMNQVTDLDAIITPVGGGGVIAGACLAKKYLKPSLQIYGAEPAQADDAYRSLKSGKIEASINPQTIADGLRTQLGDQNFPIIKELVEDIILVEEDEIIDAMKLVWERMKIVIEPSSATTFAAVKKNPQVFKGKKVGLIITGGNVDLEKLPF